MTNKRITNQSHESSSQVANTDEAQVVGAVGSNPTRDIKITPLSEKIQPDEEIHNDGGEVIYVGYVKQALKNFCEELKEKITKENLKLSWTDFPMECPICKQDTKVWSKISENPRKEICIYCRINNIKSEAKLKHFGEGLI